MAIQVDFDHIAWHSGTVAGAATGLDAACVPVEDTAESGGVFGVSDAADDCGASYAHVTYAATQAVRRLVAVLSSDVDRFSAAVTEYQNGDVETAETMLGASGRRLDVFTTHVESGHSEQADRNRDNHIDAYRDAVAETRGPTIATIDANTNITGDDGSSEELRQFVDRVGYRDAGDVGPTSEHGSRLDYVFTSPGLDSGEPERVDAIDEEVSDHDGIAVDVPVRYW